MVGIGGRSPRVALCGWGGAGRHGLRRAGRQRLLYGGCYLAATGADPEAEQAFVPGVFRLLIDNQNHVASTPAALAEETSYRTWTTYGYLAVLAFVMLVGVSLYVEWPG
jgi:hypothetical protein